MRRQAVLLAVLALVLGLAGCGGDDDDETATVAASAEENERLSADAWATYVETRDEAQTVNQASIAQFETCRDLLAKASVDRENVQECLLKATADVVAEGEQVMATLDDLDDEAAGACKSAIDQLAGYIKLYTASIQGIELGLERDELPTSVEIDGSTEVLSGSKAANAAVERDCKPV